jgi:capsular polysaccharide biosynthesis protein
MTENSSTPSRQVSNFDDPIELRPYIEALIRHWWLIIGLAVVAAVAAYLVGSRGEVTYTAEADVSLLAIHSEVVFDPQFKTVAVDDSWANREGQREGALQALAKSKSLLSEVFAQVSPQLEPKDRNFGAFMSATQAEVVGKLPSDLLRLRVTRDDPEVAMLMANAWAEHFVAVANQSYMSTSSPTLDEARVSADNAFDKYQVAQGELEAFIAENDHDLVRREIGELDVLIEELQEQKTNALRLANSTQVLSANQLANTTRDVLLEQMDQSVRSQAEDHARQLNDWYERKAALERLHLQLDDLHTQLEKGNTSTAAASGDALALMFTRAGLFRAGGTPELLLDIDLTQLGENGQDLSPDEAGALLQVVEDGLAEADIEIKRLTDELFRGSAVDIPSSIPEDHELFQVVNTQVESILNIGVTLDTGSAELETQPLSRFLDQLSDRRQTLRAQKESLDAQERELTLGRDTAWELYKTLDNKAREVEAQFATGAPQARLAVRAATPVVPDRLPDSRNRILMAAALAGMLGVLYVVGRTYWNLSAPVEESGPPAQEAPGRPLPEPQPAAE